MDRKEIIRDVNTDQLKGILMILVVIGHAIQYASGTDYLHGEHFFDNPIFLLIYAFHMPLFAIISGYYFGRSNQRDFKDVVKHKVKGILFPLLFFNVLIFVITLHEDIEYFPNLLVSLKYFTKKLIGWPLWFLCTVFIDSIIIAVVSRTTKNKKVVFAQLFIIFVCCFFIPDNIVISVHKFIFPFFCIGYLLFTNNIELCTPMNNENIKREIFFYGITSIILLVFFDKRYLVYVSGFCINDNISILWYDMYRMIVGLIVSRFICLLIPVLINKVELKWLTKLGQNTLGIYCFQTLLYLLVPSFVYHFHINNSIIGPMACFAIVLSISFILTLVCKKYIPSLVGK